MAKRRISVRLNDTIYTALESVVKHYDRSKSDIVKEALVDWLENKGFLERKNSGKQQRD